VAAHDISLAKEVDQLLGEGSADENIPLAALFGSAPINESDILPPSILQSMNLWLNDSMLTGTASSMPLGGRTIPSQIGSLGNNGEVAVQQASALAAESELAPQLQPNSNLQQQQQQQQQPQGLDFMSNLVPMDIALGLPALGVNFDPTVSAPLVSTSSDCLGGGYSSLAGFQVPGRSLGFPTDFLQQLNQQLFSFGDAPAKASTESPCVMGAMVHSPFSAAASPNPLLGPPDVGSMTQFSTSDFASLNIVNSLDLQRSAQIGQQPFQLPASADISALLANSALSPISARASADLTSAAGVGTSAGVMRPVPTSLSAASTMDSVASLFPANVSLGSSDAVSSELTQPIRHNSHPPSTMYERQASSFLTSPTLGTPPLSAGSLSTAASSKGNSAITNGVEQEFKNRLLLLAASKARTAAASGEDFAAVSSPALRLTALNTSAAPASYLTSPQLLQQQQPRTCPRVSLHATSNSGLPETPFDIPYDSNVLASTTSTPLSLSALQGNIDISPHLSKETLRFSGASTSRTSGSVAQMNNDSIPQMLRDVVDLHPELGCPELIYNLLITHVVHDCSRIGIHNAHLFWMRVKQYRMPKFYLMASIADASRSWTLPDDLRSALPPNLDEACYALAIKDAPTDSNNPNVLTSLGLLALAAYEFKSARFAPMLEHNCLAYKMMTLIKFRGATFPWRAVKRRPDANGVDSNYQLLLRAFWRIYISLFFSTEIFRLDAPEDRDFLPEMPERDGYFVQHVFVPDESEEFGFRMIRPPYQVCDTGRGDLFNIVCELYIKQYKIGNRFNRILRSEKPSMYYVNYLQEWDRQMLEWRDALPPYLKDDLAELARTTPPIDARRRRLNLSGLSEDEMWMKRHQWNQDIGRAMEVLYVHMVFDMARIKAYRIGLMLFLQEDLDMVRNFQYSKAFATQELQSQTHVEPVTASHSEDAEIFRKCAIAANEAVSHLYKLLKFSYQFGFDLHGFTPVIIGTLLQAGLVYVGQVQSKDPRLAWHAMLRLARILGMIRSLDRWGPALYIFTNILKALGRPELILQLPSPETRAQLAADTRRPAAIVERSMSVDSAATADSNPCTDSCCQPTTGVNGGGDSIDGSHGHVRFAHLNGKGKRKSDESDSHGDEKRYEFGDHQHGDPHSVSASVDSPMSSPDEDDVTNPFPPDHVISHIMREQKVSTATFFSPTLPILAASLLHNNSA
ncbi:hypothetical protein GGI02_004294, partial [Coemansia sp. RSA 2322]